MHVLHGLASFGMTEHGFTRPAMPLLEYNSVASGGMPGITQYDFTGGFMARRGLVSPFLDSWRSVAEQS